MRKLAIVRAVMSALQLSRDGRLGLYHTSGPSGPVGQAEPVAAGRDPLWLWSQSKKWEPNVGRPSGVADVAPMMMAAAAAPAAMVMQHSNNNWAPTQHCFHWPAPSGDLAPGARVGHLGGAQTRERRKTKTMDGRMDGWMGGWVDGWMDGTRMFDRARPMFI